MLLNILVYFLSFSRHCTINYENKKFFKIQYIVGFRAQFFIQDSLLALWGQSSQNLDVI
jgi:hypothetical protein